MFQLEDGQNIYDFAYRNWCFCNIPLDKRIDEIHVNIYDIDQWSLPMHDQRQAMGVVSLVGQENYSHIFNRNSGSNSLV